MKFSFSLCAMALLPSVALAACPAGDGHQRSTMDQLLKASVVFEGRVLGVVQVGSENAIYFEPTTWFLGGRPGYLYVFTPANDCGLSVQPGQLWTVIATGDPPYTDQSLRNTLLTSTELRNREFSHMRENTLRPVEAEEINRKLVMTTLGRTCAPNGFEGLAARFQPAKNIEYPTFSFSVDVGSAPTLGVDYSLDMATPPVGQPAGKAAYCISEGRCVTTKGVVVRFTRLQGDEVEGSAWLDAQHPQGKKLSFFFSGSLSNRPSCAPRPLPPEKNKSQGNGNR